MLYVCHCCCRLENYLCSSQTVSWSKRRSIQLHEGCTKRENIRKQWVKRIFFILMFTIPRRRYSVGRKEAKKKVSCKHKAEWNDLFIGEFLMKTENFLPSLLFPSCSNICFTKNKFLTNFFFCLKNKGNFLFLIISRVGFWGKTSSSFHLCCY